MNTSGKLYECHGHIMLDGINYTEAVARHKNGIDESAVRKNLQTLADAGVVYFRDGGDAHLVSAFAKKIAGEYGIHFATPAFGIHKKGRYGNIVGRAYNSLPEFKELVAIAGENGADYIKLVISGIMTFEKYGELSCPPLSPEEIAELVSVCHDAGYRVMAHINGAETIKAALEAGVDSIEHGYFIDDDCIDMLVKTKAIWVPTVAPLAAASGFAGKKGEIAAETLEKQLLAVGKAMSKGVYVASGSDSGSGGVPHGEGILRELELLKKAGECLDEKSLMEQIGMANERVRKGFVRND